LCRKVKTFPEFNTLKLGEPILLDGESATILRDAALIVGSALIEIVDEIITPKGPAYIFFRIALSFLYAASRLMISSFETERICFMAARNFISGLSVDFIRVILCSLDIFFLSVSGKKIVLVSFLSNALPTDQH